MSLAKAVAEVIDAIEEMRPHGAARERLARARESLVAVEDAERKAAEEAERKAAEEAAKVVDPA